MTDRSSSSIVDFDDGRHLDMNAVNSINQTWIDREMKLKEREFTEEAAGSVFCGTWNVNAKKQEGDLNEWLLPSDGRLADIYAVGFQEIVDLNAVNVLADNKTQQRSQYWEDQIKACLDSSRFKYVHVMTKSLVGVLLCVFARESVFPYIKDIRGTTYAVGILGIMGNKGGASVRMSFFDTSICFMCGHFAAHRDKVADRNADYKNIYEKSIFYCNRESNRIGGGGGIGGGIGGGGGRDGGLEEVAVVVPRYGADRTINIDLSIPDHDLIWFFGDFNYRIDEELSTEDVFRKIREGREGLELLKSKDQLNIERKERGTVFQGFEEDDISFQPTYKYQPGTDIYDQRPEKKIRPPAWCDRILYKSGQQGAIQQQFYRRAELKPSDHKPVMAYFDVKLLKVVKDRQDRCFEVLKRDLEFWTNFSSIPRALVASVANGVEKQAGNVSGEILMLNYAHVKFGVPIEQKIVIKNVGDSLVHWRFIPKLEEPKASKRWISISKTKGLLKGNESVEVSFTVLVDKKTAQNLNAGLESLDDVVILRIENGFDFNIGVTAEYDRSFVGMSLEELVRTTVPVRETKLLVTGDRVGQYYSQEFKDDCARATEEGNKPAALQVPKELWRLLDALFVGGAFKERDLFSPVASELISNDVRAILEALDTGSDLPDNCNPHALVDVLITFLTSLPEPVLPATFYPESDIDSSRVRQYCRKIFESREFPLVNYNVFVYVLSFMKEMIAFNTASSRLNSEKNVLLVERLSLAALSALTNLAIPTDGNNNNNNNNNISNNNVNVNSNAGSNASDVNGSKASGGAKAGPASASAAAASSAAAIANANNAASAALNKKIQATIEIFKFLLTSSAI